MTGRNVQRMLVALALSLLALSALSCNRSSDADGATETQPAATGDAPARAAEGKSDGEGAQRGGGMRGQFMAEAAKALGVTEEALTEALGTPPDLAKAAKKLDISLEKLQEVIPSFGGGFGGGVVDSERMAEAAKKLGMEQQKLQDALGEPMNINAAAEKLGISAEKIQEALGLTQRGFGRQ